MQCLSVTPMRHENLCQASITTFSNSDEQSRNYYSPSQLLAPSTIPIRISPRVRQSDYCASAINVPVMESISGFLDSPNRNMGRISHRRQRSFTFQIADAQLRKRGGGLFVKLKGNIQGPTALLLAEYKAILKADVSQHAFKFGHLENELDYGVYKDSSNSTQPPAYLYASGKLVFVHEYFKDVYLYYSSVEKEWLVYTFSIYQRLIDLCTLYYYFMATYSLFYFLQVCW